MITGEEDDREAIILDTTSVPIGGYTLTEVAPPSGYNSLEGPVKITVAEGSAAGDIVVTATINGQTSAFAEVERVNVSGSAPEWIITIRNDAGAVLPSTGGPGTMLIYMLGCILILGSGVLLWMRRSLM